MGFLLILCPVLAGAPTEAMRVDVDVYPQVVLQDTSPLLVGTDLAPQVGDKSRLTRPATLERIKSLGIKTIRFPGGCSADRYNWKSPAPGEITVDEFLSLCDAVEAEPVYVLNMQGGTEGLAGSPAPDAPVAERIRYRHVAANSCGATDHHFGTLAETLELVHKYTIDRFAADKRPLTHFQLGQANWAQAKTDWPPEVYAKSVEGYAAGVLQAVVEYSQLKKSKPFASLPYFTAVGYPLTGTAPLLAAEDSRLNLAWTAALNQIADLGQIDAICEAFDPGKSSSGALLRVSERRFVDALSTRSKAPTEAEPEGAGPRLDYQLPVEWALRSADCGGSRPGDPSLASPKSGSPKIGPVGTLDLLRACLEFHQTQAYADQVWGEPPCGLVAPNDAVAGVGAALELLAGRIGDQVVRCDLSGPALEFSATTTRRGNDIFVILVNRSDDRSAHVQLNLHGGELKAADWREISGDKSDAPAATMQAGDLAVTSPLLSILPPASARVVRAQFAQILDVPLVLNTSKLERAVRSWDSISGDTFQISTTSYQPVRYAIDTDVPWLTLQPAVGGASIYKAEDIQVAYDIGELAPGTHQATIRVSSPDVYNSPQAIHVSLTLRAPRADFDNDGDVDQLDLTRFEACMMAPAPFQASPACEPARLDDDDDVDLDDIQLFLFCMSGADVRPGPECVE